MEQVIETEDEAKKADVKNPPKVGRDSQYSAQTVDIQQVVFHDQHGHKVAHNPGTLEVTDEK